MDVLLSIIVPIYRVEEYLHQCIDSIINQTYMKLEILLIDDGSDDNCPAICDEYARTDKRIRVIHKTNGGADSARKVGIMAATGKYVGYVDGDDWIEPHMYERLIYLAETYKVNVVESGVIDTVYKNTFIRTSRLNEGVYIGTDFEKEIEPFILYGGTFFEYGITGSLCNKIFERGLIKKYQMLPETSAHLADDIMCSLPCIVDAKSIYITYEAFYHYRVRNNSYKYTLRKDIADIVGKCFPDWVRRFSSAKNLSCIEKQMEYVAMYLLLMKAAYVFDDIESGELLIPFGGIESKKKIVLYGAGATGIYLYDYLTNQRKINVIWVDKNYKNFQNDLPVVSPDILRWGDYDYIVISVLWASKVDDIKKDIMKQGVSDCKIRWICNEYILDSRLLLKKAAINGHTAFSQL